MGWNAQPTCAVSLDNVVIQESQRLGQEGQGFSLAMTACESRAQHCLRVPYWHLQPGA